MSRAPVRPVRARRASEARRPSGPEPRAETTPGLVVRGLAARALAAAPWFSAGRTTATTSPAQALQRHRSFETLTCSYFSPVADQVVIDAGQFDRFGVIAPNPLNQSLNRCVEIENQAAGVSIPYHALQPEKRRNPRAPGHRSHQMQTRRRINYEITRRQLDFVGSIAVLDHELAAIILFRFR